MNLSEIEKFATRARRNLTEGVDAALATLGFTDKMPEAPVAVQGGWTYRGEIVEDADFGPRWKGLKEFIEKEGRKVAVERAAYTWFNRLVAIRILAKRGLVQPQLEWADASAHVPQIVHRMRTGGWIPNLSPGEDAALAHVRRDPTKTREQFAVLVGAFCRETPILKAAFGEIDDWTMLLVPSNLLADGGLVDDLNNSALLSDDDYCQDELIGWLYQYYIAERKAEVYDGFKKNKKAGVAEIPAATQIFTPHWIVKYLVENTLTPPATGNSLTTNDYPLTTTFIDPCCGSGHILLEAFRRFLAAYDDLGYSKRDAIAQIFERNITGIDIDPRARQLSAFALLIAAAKEDESFADAHALPRVFDTSSAIISPIPGLAENGIAKALDTANKAAVGEMAAALGLLRERGDTVGSLLKLDISQETRALVETRLGDVEDEGLRRALALVLALTAKYDALVTNPPYLGAGNLDGDLKKYLEENYKDGKSDLFASFILRLLELCKDGGRVGMITMQSWMFLSSFEALRCKILEEKTILSMLHLGAHAFDSIGGEVTQTTAFVIANEYMPNYEATYYRLVDGQNEAEKEAMFKEENNG
ncbi:MAG: N-6 DNA methylase [Kiritimatiellae bacterium]|nr:N-6 DNA methylase [Kiritimatiellia bacterium]